TSSKAAKTRTTALEAQTSSSDYSAGDEHVNPVARKPCKGGDENGKPKTRSSDTPASFSADSVAST
ncbi:hypothetical protein IWW55_004911, partial [Coemansia sp. RSA 2706]